MEHSKTPWKIGTPPPNGEQTIGTIDGLMVAVTTTGYGLSSEANARRIVACINACRDIETEVLEMETGSTALFGRIAGKLTKEKMALQDKVTELTDQLTTERASLFAESQRKQQLERQVEELVGVLENVLPWVVTQEVACHGLKCREPVCMSCSSDSEEAAEKATYAYEEARAVIQKVRGGEC